MNDSKNIQIPYALFLDLFKYFESDTFRTPEREQAIKKALADKMERIVRHNAFINKTAP